MQDNGNTDLWKLECEFATNPESLAFVKLANAYLDMGRFIEAMVVAKKGIKYHPELAAGRMILTRIYIDQAKHKKAIGELQQLIRSQPGHSDAFRTLGEIHLKLGHREDGVRFLKKALDMNPDDRGARNSLIRIGIEYPPARAKQVPTRRRLIEDVPPLFEAAVKKTGRAKLRRTLYLAVVLTILLSCYLVYTYREGVRQEKINDHVRRARVLFAQDSFPGYSGALEHYREILRLDESHLDSLSRAAYSCAVLVGEHGVDRKLIDEGRGFLDRVRTQGEKTAITSAAEGLLKLYGGGGPSEAIRTLEKAVKQYPRSSSIHTALGLAYLGKGDLRRATEHLQRSAAKRDLRAIHGLGRCYLRLSLHRRAFRTFALVLQEQRDHVGAALNKATISILEGNSTEEAALVMKRYNTELKDKASGEQKSKAAFIETALKARADPRALSELATTDATLALVASRELRRAGRLEEAMQVLKSALQKEPSRPDLIIEEASVLLDRNEYAAARSRAIRARETNKVAGKPDLHIARAYQGERNHEKAIEYFNKATSFTDTAVEAFISLAKIYAGRNLAAKFKEAVERAIAADPSNPEPYCLIGENLDMSSVSGREQMREYCGKCLNLGAGSGNSRLTAACRKRMRVRGR